MSDGGVSSAELIGVEVDTHKDLNRYCSALIDMLAENVPEVKDYLEENVWCSEESSEAPEYETLLLVLEVVIQILPK